MGSDSGGVPAPRDNARESAAPAATRTSDVMEPKAINSEPKKESSKPKTRQLESKENPREVYMTGSKPEGTTAPDVPKNDTALNVNEQLLNQMTNDMRFSKIRSEKALILPRNRSLESSGAFCQ